MDKHGVEQKQNQRRAHEFLRLEYLLSGSQQLHGVRGLILDSKPVYLPPFDVGISAGETLWMACYGSMYHSDLDSV